MSDFLKIEVKDDGVQNLLQKLLQKTGNLRPTMRKISETMQEAVWKNFDSEGKRVPGGWPNLKKVTEKSREKDRPGLKASWPGKILQVERNLYKISEDHGDDFAMVGSKEKYARLHQLGGWAGRGRKVWVSARPFLVLTDEDMEDIKEDVREDILK